VTDELTTSFPPPRTLSGQYAVVAMFVLGIAATTFLWTYWNTRMIPFMPLQKALEQRFPDSAPRAEGGTTKESEQTVLLVAMRADFDPLAETPEAVAAVNSRMEATRELALELIDLDSYEILAVHLYFPLKEEKISQQTFFRDVATWQELDRDEIKGLALDPARERP